MKAEFERFYGSNTAVGGNTAARRPRLSSSSEPSGIVVSDKCNVNALGGTPPSPASSRASSRPGPPPSTSRKLPSPASSRTSSRPGPPPSTSRISEWGSFDLVDAARAVAAAPAEAAAIEADAAAHRGTIAFNSKQAEAHYHRGLHLQDKGDALGADAEFRLLVAALKKLADDAAAAEAAAAAAAELAAAAEAAAELFAAAAAAAEAAAFETRYVEPVIGGIPDDATRGGRQELPGVGVKRALKAGFVAPVIDDIPGAAALGDAVPADRPNDTIYRSHWRGRHRRAAPEALSQVELASWTRSHQQGTNVPTPA